MTIENKILIFLSFLIVFVFTDWILRTIRSIEGVAGQRRRSLRRRVSVDGRRGRSAVSRHLSPMKLDLKRDVVVKRKRVYSLSPRMYLKWSFYLVRKGVLLKYVWNFTQSGLVSSRWCGNYSDAVGWGLKLQRRIEVGDLCNCSWFLVFFFYFSSTVGCPSAAAGIWWTRSASWTATLASASTPRSRSTSTPNARSIRRSAARGRATTCGTASSAAKNYSR